MKLRHAAGLQLRVQTGVPSAEVYGNRLTASTALVPRLLPSRALPTPNAFSLMPQPRGALANLKPVPLTHASMTQLQPGQVLLQVRSVGLNFRDVLNVLGMYPGDPGPPGADCAGVVVATGAGVMHLTPGMAVFGLAAGSLGSHVVSRADTLVSLHLCTVKRAALFSNSCFSLCALVCACPFQAGIDTADSICASTMSSQRQMPLYHVRPLMSDNTSQLAEVQQTRQHAIGTCAEMTRLNRSCDEDV